MSSTTEAFLDGQGIPVDPSRIEAELDALWGPAADQAGGPDVDQPSVTKLVLANLVVSGLGPDADSIAPVLRDVVAQFPCRVIVLRTDDNPDRAVRAEISAVCHLPSPGRPQVCGERIVLTAGKTALDLLPGAVRPLLESDLPSVLWWTDDPRDTSGLFFDLIDEATRAIIDRPDPAADPAFLSAAPDWARDAVWHGIVPWREAVAQMFDAADAASELASIASVEVTARVAVAKLPRAACWLIAWLAGQLGWRPRSRAPVGQGGVKAVFEAAHGPVSVAIRAEVDPDETSAKLIHARLTIQNTDGESFLDVARVADQADELRIETCSPTHCNLPRLVRAPALDRARRVASALEVRHDDEPYRKALPIARWLLGVAEPGDQNGPSNGKNR